MIPIADMQVCENAYHYENEVGRINTWEYYFEQPAGISVNEALAYENFTVRDTVLCPNPRQYAPFYYNQDGQLDYWRGICRKYIRFKPQVLERLTKLNEAAQGKRILGVLVRGTDYVALKPKDHPIPPTAEQAIAKTREVMQEKVFDIVYLATEDKNILAKFQEAFNEKLLLPEAQYINYDYDNPKFLADYDPDRKNDKYLRGLEYLVSMLFLSKCQGFITSITSGSVGVMCLSEGFDYLYVFDLGLYP